MLGMNPTPVLTLKGFDTALPTLKKNPPTVLKEVFICAHHTAAANHFDWPTSRQKQRTYKLH